MLAARMTQFMYGGKKKKVKASQMLGMMGVQL